MNLPQRSASRRCSDQPLSEYVAGRLAVGPRLDVERHLVGCNGCRAKVDDERAIFTAMRAVPMAPADLRAALLSVSSTAGLEPVDWTVDHGAVGILAADAPAFHRSALRSVVVAAVVAGATAAAAWSLIASSGISGSATSGVPTPVVPAAFTFAPTPTAPAADQLPLIGVVQPILVTNPGTSGSQGRSGR